MGRVAASGALYTGASQALRILISTASGILVARLMAPEQFGIVAMVAPISGFILIFQNLGLSHAAIQSTTLTEGQASALFWVNVLASLVIAVTLVAVAPLIALFYHEPRAGSFAAATALTVIVSGLGIQHSAQLSRGLRFRALSGVDVAAAAATAGATLAAAYLRRDYWALWIGALAGAATTTLLVWVTARWRPSFRINLKPAMPMLRFGAGMTGVNLLNFLSRNLDNVLIAKAWGPHAVGLYDRSYKLMMFPLQNINTPLSRVILPILARLRDDPERYRRLFLMAVRAILFICVPGAAVAASTSDRLIPFLLGARWEEASPIFFWLSLTALTQPLGNALGWLFISYQRTVPFVQWNLFAAGTTLVAFMIGLPWGPVGVAAAYFVSSVSRLPLLIAWSARETPIRAMNLYAVLAPALAGAGLTWLFVKALSPHLSLPVLLVVGLLGAYAVGALCQVATPGGREALKALIALAKDYARTKRRGVS